MPLMAIETRYSTAPTVTDDVSKGYGDRWLWEDQVTGNVYKCLNNSVGAAVWVVMSTASGNTPLINQPTPTTSTVGYLGQVIFDTDGNEWTYIGLDGTKHAWSPNNFPAVNTEYYNSYDAGLGKFIMKYEYSGTTPASLILTTYPITAIGNAKCVSLTGWVDTSTNERIFVPALIYNGASRGGIHTNVISNVFNISISVNAAGFQSKPLTVYISYYRV